MVSVMKSKRAMTRQLETPLNVHGNLNKKRQGNNVQSYLNVKKKITLNIIILKYDLGNT